MKTSWLNESLAGALLHLVRNAVDHGIESCDERMRLGRAARGTVVLEISTSQKQENHGDRRWTWHRSFNHRYENCLFCPGFSTAAEVSEISGRGVGLDVVKTAVRELRRSSNRTKRHRARLNLRNHGTVSNALATKRHKSTIDYWCLCAFCGEVVNPWWPNPSSDASCANSLLVRTQAQLATARPRRKPHR